MFEIVVIVILVLGCGYVLWSWINGSGTDGVNAETGSTETGNANEMAPTTAESASNGGNDAGGVGSGGGGGGDGG